MSIDEGRTFLSVKQSISGKRWVDRLTPSLDTVALDIAQKADIPDLIARILAGRGVRADEAVDFLNPTIKNLMPDPHVFQDMEVAAKRIADAVEKQQTVAIFGDYDVDGATSSAVLYRFLTAFGVSARIYIPDRILEGYGPNPAAIRQLVEEGAELIVTVDCGVSSFEALIEAEKLGVDVVVLDHHQVGTELPPAHAIVNPNRHDDRSNLGHLAAVGVTFMAVVAIHRILRASASQADAAKSFDLLKLLDLVALGTVCDVVPLQTLNRAFVTKGIIAMRSMANVGLSALARVSRVEGPLEPYHLGFLLGPRINAGGRIGDAGLGARLLTMRDAFEADEVAQRLDVLNAERQALEKAMLEEADAQAFAEVGVDETVEGGPSVLITSSSDWHPGVLGIVASRLKDRYRRPSFALAFDASGKGTGSGRSMNGVDLGKAVRLAVEEGLLQKGGGHEMAAGLTVEREKLGDLRIFFEEMLKDDVAKARASRSITVDGALTARGASLQLMAEIDRAGPYGPGHPSPIFAFPSHRITYANEVGKGHVKLSLKAGDGASLNAIAFRVADEPLGKALLENKQKPMHLVGHLSKNSWQGRVTPQLRVIDAALPNHV
ncbi:MAG: single-stranded-DNA-specific exonuclease RecJ [Hyphomicrobiales bacterium]